MTVNAGKCSHTPVAQCESHSSGGFTFILFGNIPPVDQAHYHDLCDIVT